MAKWKDAWRVASLLVDLRALWATVNEKNPITPTRIVNTLKRIHQFFVGACVLLVLCGCQSKVNVRVYKHVPEPELANERSLLVPTQVVFEEPVVEPPKPEFSVLVKPVEYDVILHVDEGKTSSRGSGTLYRSNAIVTCYHLFTDSKKGITVTFRDGTKVKGRLIEYDKTYDLACVEIDPVQYRPAKVSDSKNLAGQFEARGYGAEGEGFRSVRGSFVRWASPSNSGSVASTLVLNSGVRSGDSGGGIFNDGGLYGVIWGSRDGETYGTSGAGFRQFIQRCERKLNKVKADRIVVYSDPEICAPCAQLVPVLARLKAAGYNVVELKPTPSFPRMPTLVYYAGDEIVEEFIGFDTYENIQARLKK
jgi:small nuclear ribonucleoprotein (snRNP)-like protein